MAETPRGIVYPESDAHTRLWEHYQTLAETADDAINDAVLDSGWTNIPYTAGWVTSGSTPLSVRKIGDVCYVRGRVTTTSGSIAVTAASGIAIGTLPAGFSPAYDVFTLIASQNPGNTPARLSVWSDGTALTLYTYHVATSYVSVDFSYLVS